MHLQAMCACVTVRLQRLLVARVIRTATFITLITDKLLVISH